MNKTDKNPNTPPAPETPVAPETPPEHIASLDDLLKEITGTEAAAEQAKAATSAADFKTKAESWAFIPAMFGKIIAMALPELAEVYNEPACLAWGEAMVPVADKYGWGDPAVSVEVGLILATVPMALPTFVAVKKYLDERKQHPQHPQTAPQRIAQDTPPTNNAAPQTPPQASHILPDGLFAGDLRPNATQARQPA